MNNHGRSDSPDQARRNSPRRFIGILIVFLVGLWLGWWVRGLPDQTSTVGTLITKLKALGAASDSAALEQVWQTINSDFVSQPVDESKLFEGAISGIVESLHDPYSVYLSPSETQDFKREIQGTFEGIGAEIGIKRGQLTVIAPLSGSPADQAGLLANDVILEIDDQTTSGLSLDEAVQRLRGLTGTIVKLNIKSGETAPRVVEITRDKIEVKSVTLEKRPIGQNTNEYYAYLKLTSFTSTTDVEVRQLARELLVDQPAGIVLDMRNNPGGILDSAVEIAGIFLDKDVTILYEEQAEQRTPHTTTEAGDLKDIPLTVIVNGGSASASEIVAGAFQANGRAKIVGQKTFGKGTVQNFVELKNRGSLKLTVARWLTPDGQSIDEAGITPDQTIDLTDEDYDADRDPQLDGAVSILAASINDGN